mmetsp:Transcript_9663/g.14555  ORF Transcript_9663/g.14555 Transcript_9663/m.14555 type:complete len:451 (+) Transcript_9663:23-1375(+)
MSSLNSSKLQELLEHPTEIWPTLNLLIRQYSAMNSKDDFDPNDAYCMWILSKTSRSFALVIQELDAEMRKAICLFYLILRGLDTIEDDVAFLKDNPAEKRKMLCEFHETIEKRGWNLTGCGETKYERHLMENFHVIIDQYLRLKKRYRLVIKDITQRMGHGMAEFLGSGTDRVHTIQEWDKYCHYVAGLVGIGLSNLFASSTLEDPSFANADKLSNSMGLFLQKTNIIRDYYEDMVETRAFWPEEVWSKYAKELDEFMLAENRKNAVCCLNELVTNALEHIPDCLEYMGRLRTRANFSFCAIPQVMAIGTLAACYNNPQVFTPNRVKMRLGEMSMVFHQTQSMEDVYLQFDKYLEVIQQKLPNPRIDPTSTRTRKLLAKLKSLTSTHARHSNKQKFLEGASIPLAHRPGQTPSSSSDSPNLLKAITGLMFAAGSSYFMHPRRSKAITARL